jgi:hypothetical protein
MSFYVTWWNVPKQSMLGNDILSVYIFWPCLDAYNLIFVSGCFNQDWRSFYVSGVFCCVCSLGEITISYYKFYCEAKDQRDLKVCTVCSKIYDWTTVHSESFDFNL